MTEVRAILGGFFIALGAAPIIFGSLDLFLMLGIACLVAAAVRFMSMFIDKSLVQSNYLGVASEVFLGIILVL